MSRKMNLEGPDCSHCSSPESRRDRYGRRDHPVLCQFVLGLADRQGCQP
jgi:hypothetical protein